MNLLDRAIARQYLLNVLMLLGVLLSLIVLIDFSLNFDEFVKASARAAEARGEPPPPAILGAPRMALELWWPRLFQMFHYLLGVTLVAGAGFTAVQLVRHREVVAMLAAGISLHRAARPFFIVAFALVALQAINREAVIPSLAPLLVRQHQTIGAADAGMGRQSLISDASGRLYLARSFDPASGELIGLTIWDRDERGVMRARVTADRATYSDGAWKLVGGRGIAIAQPEPGRATPETVAIDSVPTELDPTLLRVHRFEGYALNLSWAQLGDLIDRARSQPQPPIARIEGFERLQYARLTVYVANILTLAMCLPLFFRREPTSPVIATVKAAPIAIVGSIGAAIAAIAPLPGLPPMVSCFLPVMVLGPIALASWTSMRT